MVEIFLLEQLVVFAEFGTLTRAAEELRITQPALSRSMKKLETLFGVPLFERSNSKIALNETGKVAAEYAKKVLEADQEMVKRTVAFDRSRHTVSVGACAALPINLLKPLLRSCFRDMEIISEIVPDDRLVQGLKKHEYQIAILHEPPGDEDIFWRKYMDEHLHITFPSGHALAAREKVSFQDLEGMSILAHGEAGFWIEICRQNLKNGKLLTQDSVEVLQELVDASSLPAFSSDQVPENGFELEGRISVPICDRCAHVSYYLACLRSEKQKYHALIQNAGQTP